MVRKRLNQDDNGKQLKKKLKKKNKGSTRLKTTANSYQIVPWYSRFEWEEVCGMFNREEWSKIFPEILIWKERVPALPVGVESTLFLVQAILHDTPANKSTNEESRSLYSLSIIRFLNHVSHLATKEMGGISVLPMFKLASHVNVPEWIVNLRHEASHGTALPSLEILRLAASFVKTWLKENYWVPIEVEVIPANRNNVLDNDNFEELEIELSHKIRQLVSALIATRIYKLRQCASISDQQILRLLPSYNQQNAVHMKTKTVIIMLKRKIENFLVSEPNITCTVLAQEMIPQVEFYKEISAIFHPNDPFEQFCLVLNPVIKLLQSRGKLTVVCARIAELQSGENASEYSTRMCAAWLDKLLEKIQETPNDSSTANELRALIPTILKSPSVFTNIYIDRLLQLVENKIGTERTRKLKMLVSIWSDDLSNYNVSKYKRMKGALRPGEIFTTERLLPVHQEDSAMIDQESNTVEGLTVDKIQLDTRSAQFWRKIPLGALI